MEGTSMNISQSKFQYMWAPLIILFLGCASSAPLDNTKNLRPGMTIEEVKAVLGEPYQTSFESGVYCMHYHLQYYMNDAYPYLTAFDSNNKLIFFGFNNEESRRRLEAINTLKGTPALPQTIQIQNK